MRTQSRTPGRRRRSLASASLAGAALAGAALTALAALAGVAALAGAAASAQDAPPPAAADISLGDTYAGFLDRVDVEVVNVDVVVTDAKRQPVLDLALEDFELLVDGQPVEVSYFASPK